MAQLFHRSTNSLSNISIFAVVLGAGLLLAFAYSMDRGSYITDVKVVKEQPVPFSHKHHVTDDGIDCRYCHTSVEVSGFAGIPPTKTCMNCHSQIWFNAPMLEPVRESFRSGRSLVWTRANALPDFVYFDHSIHINKGVGCNTCHGAVDKMPLMYNQASLQMEFCLDCHRDPEKYIRPHHIQPRPDDPKSEIDQVFNMTYQPPTSLQPVTLPDGKKFTDQAALGAYLAGQYHLRSERDITSCNTCHR